MDALLVVPAPMKAMNEERPHRNFKGFPIRNHFRAAADGEKIHTYLQTLRQHQSVSRKELQADKS
jgi:hypothetical protein